MEAHEMIGAMGRAATVGFLAAVCISGCSTQEEAQQSFKSLIARGFKVVATSFIPAEATPDKNSVIVVTLQQDKAVAVCVAATANWELLTAAFVDIPKQCDVRFY
jgi:hypothetical protein